MPSANLFEQEWGSRRGRAGTCRHLNGMPFSLSSPILIRQRERGRWAVDWFHDVSQATTTYFCSSGSHRKTGLSLCCPAKVLCIFTPRRERAITCAPLLCPQRWTRHSRSLRQRSVCIQLPHTFRHLFSFWFRFYDELGARRAALCDGHRPSL